MSNDNSSIHDFDINLICEYFSYVKRQGPGSPEVTLKALSFIDNLTSKSQIADLGCGTGGQTMVLGQNAPGHITGMDLFPRFINLFNANTRKFDLQERVKGITGSMDNLPFEKESLDLIWSEGAIYNIGFENGLKTWHPFLKQGGYVAVSEATWFTSERPAEVESFWNSEYPEINIISRKIAHMENAGFIPVASFILPENCWTDHFYTPQVDAEKIFLEKHAGNKMAEEFIATQRYERELYNKNKEFYGYTFFIGKKI